MRRRKPACNHPFIGTEHILLGLIDEGEGVGARALAALGISGEAIRGKVEEEVGMAGTSPTSSPPFTPRAKKVLELALREALQLNHSYIGTEHILLGLVREGEGVAAVVLVNLGRSAAGAPRGDEACPEWARAAEQRARRRSCPREAIPGPAAEPRCPQCRRSLGSGAHYRGSPSPRTARKPIRSPSSSCPAGTAGQSWTW